MGSSFQKKKDAQDSTKKTSDDNLNPLKVGQKSDATNATEAYNDTGMTATSDTSGQENSKNSESQNDSDEGIQKRKTGQQKTLMESGSKGSGSDKGNELSPTEIKEVTNALRTE